jgi:hypothetical protein
LAVTVLYVPLPTAPEDEHDRQRAFEVWQSSGTRPLHEILDELDAAADLYPEADAADEHQEGPFDDPAEKSRRPAFVTSSAAQGHSTDSSLRRRSSPAGLHALISAHDAAGIARCGTRRPPTDSFSVTFADRNRWRMLLCVAVV